MDKISRNRKYKWKLEIYQKESKQNVRKQNKNRNIDTLSQQFIQKNKKKKNKISKKIIKNYVKNVSKKYY